MIKAVNDAPEEYPSYEEDMEEWQAEVSDQVQISDILDSIEDDLIRDEYTVLTGIRNRLSKETPAVMRQGMARILLENPDRMLLFMTAEMRKVLSRQQQGWIDSGEKCVLAKLYSFGFCRLPEINRDVISVPEGIREIYFSKLKSTGEKDKIADAAEVFLRRCGVMETQFLYEAVTRFMKCRIPMKSLNFWCTAGCIIWAILQ